MKTQETTTNFNNSFMRNFSENFPKILYITQKDIRTLFLGIKISIIQNHRENMNNRA